MSDPINPDHYRQGKVECIDALEAATEGLQGIEAVCTANAIKYLWRWKRKGGRQDLEKARWYLQRLIDAQPKEGGRVKVDVQTEFNIAPFKTSDGKCVECGIMLDSVLGMVCQRADCPSGLGGPKGF